MKYLLIALLLAGCGKEPCKQHEAEACRYRCEPMSANKPFNIDLDCYDRCMAHVPFICGLPQAATEVHP